MNTWFPLLADSEPADQMLLLKSMGHTGWAQTGIIFGAIGLVALAAFGSVYIFRRRILRRRHHRHHRSAQATVANATPNPPPEESGKVKKRWRRSRHAHRPLNPTLAQTHGLPPMRDQRTPPPPAP